MAFFKNKKFGIPLLLNIHQSFIFIFLSFEHFYISVKGLNILKYFLDIVKFIAIRSWQIACQIGSGHRTRRIWHTLTTKTFGRKTFRGKTLAEKLPDSFRNLSGKVFGQGVSWFVLFIYLFIFLIAVFETRKMAKN